MSAGTTSINGFKLVKTERQAFAVLNVSLVKQRTSEGKQGAESSNKPCCRRTKPPTSADGSGRNGEKLTSFKCTGLLTGCNFYRSVFLVIKGIKSSGDVEIVVLIGIWFVAKVGNREAEMVNMPSSSAFQRLSLPPH